MFYNELSQIILREKQGYIVNLKYDRFAQINFPSQNKSLIVIADFKDFEIISNPDNIQLIVNYTDDDSQVKTDTQTVYLSDYKGKEEHVLFTTNKGTIIVISKEMTTKVHVDGLMVLYNRETALDLVANFSIDKELMIKIPFSNAEKTELTKFINKAGRMVHDIDLGITDDKPYIIISAKYNLIHELGRNNKEKITQKITEKAVKKIREIQENDTIISDEELSNLLEEYSEMSQESKFWFVETEYTEEDYLNEYSRLCEELKRDYHKDGKVEFLYDPSVRNAITDKNCELR